MPVNVALALLIFATSANATNRGDFKISAAIKAPQQHINFPALYIFEPDRFFEIESENCTYSSKIASLSKNTFILDSSLMCEHGQGYSYMELPSFVFEEPGGKYSIELSEEKRTLEYSVTIQREVTTLCIFSCIEE